MAEPILGEALALQSNFKPDTTPVLTKSLLRAEEMDMRKALAKQKAEEAKQKRLDAATSAIKPFEAKLNPYFLPEGQKTFSGLITGMMEARKQGRDLDAVQLQQQGVLEAQRLQLRNDEMERFFNLPEKEFLNDKELRSIRNMPAEKGRGELGKLLERRPELRVMVSQDEQGDPIFNPIKNIPIEDELGKIMRDNERLFTEKVGSRKKDANTFEFVYKMPKDKVEALATELSLNPEIQANIIFKERAGYDAVYDKIVKDNPNLDPMQAQQKAVQLLLDAKIEKINQKTEDSSVPTGSGFNISVGGGYKVGENVFNPTLADPAFNLGAYKKAGIIDDNYTETFDKLSPEKQQEAITRIQKNVGDLLSISGPNKAGYSLVNEDGKKVYLDNIDFVYVPKTVGGKGGQWMVKGVSKEKKGDWTVENLEYIPINEKTYGNIISIYPKMTEKDIVTMFNQRMQDGGIKNDRFVLRTGSGRRPQSTGKPAPATKGGNKTEDVKFN
jgi:hypothetical protein